MNLKQKLVTVLSGGASDSYLLVDGTTDAFAAYSTVKLRETYEGSAIRLRRDSDNAESDFGFVGVNLDVDAITTWLAGANGYLRTLYDQSGNSRNVIQTVTTRQPLFVADVQNGQSAIRSDGVDDFLRALSQTITQPYTLYSAWIPRTLNVKQVVSFNASYMLQNESRTTMNAGSSLFGTLGTLALDTAHIATGVYDGVSSVSLVNGGNSQTGDVGAGGGNQIVLFADAAVVIPANIDMLATVIFDEAHDVGERGAVNSYFGTVYDIPLA